MQKTIHRAAIAAAVLAVTVAVPSAGSFAQGAGGTTRGNAQCPGEDVFYDPGSAQDIVVPAGYKAEVFARDLNFPTAIAFMGDGENFKVLVLESGSGLPGRCNNPDTFPATAAANPLTPDVLVFDQDGHQMAGPLGKPGVSTKPFQTHGPAIGLAFERVFQGGRLFATDSNQGTDGGSPPGSASNNSSRIVNVDLAGNGAVSPFITGLPTGDHPTEQVLVKDGFIYWSQGSATNSSVVGHDNAGGTHQHDIPCQTIKLSDNTFDSGDGHMTSGFSNHGVARPGATVPAFDSATQSGMCTGAILRANINARDPASTIQPVSWGYRNPFGIRFSPNDHPLKGRLFVTENGEDERGARPTNNAPDRLQVAEMNPDGTPDYHGWPDRFGFLESTQALFNPVGGPADDACPTSAARPSGSPAEIACLRAHGDIPVRHVLAFPPQPPKAPLGIEPADVAVVGPDFAPRSFTGSVVERGAALVAREGDFGFSAGNGQPEEGHDVQLVNFSSQNDALSIDLMRFAFNCKTTNQAHLPNGASACKANPKDLASADISGDQAFTDMLHAIDRPVTLMFGPDHALYLVDFGAVRDFGQSDPDAQFRNPADAPLVQIPHTGTIWKISRVGSAGREEDDADD
jgi:glucose/arabinose dehydrogenase